MYFHTLFWALKIVNKDPILTKCLLIKLNSLLHSFFSAVLSYSYLKTTGTCDLHQYQ